MQSDHPDLSTPAVVKGGTTSPVPSCQIYLKELEKFSQKCLLGFRLLPNKVQDMLGEFGKKYFGTVQNQWMFLGYNRSKVVEGGIRLGKQEKEDKEAGEM